MKKKNKTDFDIKMEFDIELRVSSFVTYFEVDLCIVKQFDPESLPMANLS